MLTQILLRFFESYMVKECWSLPENLRTGDYSPFLLSLVKIVPEEVRKCFLSQTI